MSVPSVGVSETARPDLTAIRERCEAATEGPWAWATTAEKGYGANVGAGVFAEDDEECERPLSGDLNDRKDDYFVNEPIADLGHQDCNSDAAFIASARTDLPACIAYISSLESRLVSLERDRERLDWILSGADGRVPWQILHGFGGDVFERKIGIDYAIRAAISGTQEDRNG